MDDTFIHDLPPVLPSILRETAEIGFDLGSEAKTGALLRVLAASKPGGRFLELGTGTGIATAWLLAGMDSTARLDSVDCDPAAQAIARRHLGGDPRVTLHIRDAKEFLLESAPESFDLIFADALAGKFSDLELALSRVRGGGFYVVDDLLPQPNWPEGHAPKVPALIEVLEARDDFTSVKLAWASGIAVLVRTRSAVPVAR